MLSRRIVRVKVMQALYAMSRDNDMSVNDALKLYRDSVAQSYELYLFNMAYYLEVARYAFKDAENRKAKLRPNEDDLRFTPKLAANFIAQGFDKNALFQTELKKHDIMPKIDSDNIKSLYAGYLRTDDYRGYVRKRNVTDDDHLYIMLHLYKHLTDTENFNDMMEDHYWNWVDDESLVVGAGKKSIKAQPTSEAFFEEFFPSDEAVKEFGEDLLVKVSGKKAMLIEHIEPNLRNWDADRVAVMDMLLLKMAVCELLEFKSIPTKVTLNEYVEIAKSYSTDKSKEFVNGLLDRLMKKLSKDGLIEKEGRGLVE